MTLYHETCSSPVGTLHIVANDKSLLAISFGSVPSELKKDPACKIEKRGNEITRKTVQQLKEYFCGQRRKFSLPLSPKGTPFQLAAWKALEEIPYGQTVSYSDQAKQIGKPKAVRAVGAANGRNPIAIVIPCHRVIGRSGKLVGYGGGLNIKQKLIALEQREQA